MWNFGRGWGDEQLARDQQHPVQMVSAAAVAAEEERTLPAGFRMSCVSIHTHIRTSSPSPLSRNNYTTTNQQIHSQPLKALNCTRQSSGETKPK